MNIPTYSATFTASDGTVTTSDGDFGLMMGAPNYGALKRKAIVIDIPFSSTPLVFDEFYGNPVYEEQEVTYKFYHQHDHLVDPDIVRDAMRKVDKFQVFCSNFHGSITDSVQGSHANRSLTHARCTSFDYVVYPMSGVVVFTVKFKGTYIHYLAG